MFVALRCGRNEFQEVVPLQKPKHPGKRRGKLIYYMFEPVPRNMAALQAKIAGVLAMKPQCFITHPSELHALQGMTAAEVRAFAEKHGWRSVRRVGGRQIEFYNDATVQSDLTKRN